MGGGGGGVQRDWCSNLTDEDFKEPSCEDNIVSDFQRTVYLQRDQSALRIILYLLSVDRWTLDHVGLAGNLTFSAFSASWIHVFYRGQTLYLFTRHFFLTPRNSQFGVFYQQVIKD